MLNEIGVSLVDRDGNVMVGMQINCGQGTVWVSMTTTEAISLAVTLVDAAKRADTHDMVAALAVPDMLRDVRNGVRQAREARANG